MKLSTLCTLVPLVPTLHAFVLPDINNKGIQEVFQTFEKSTKNEKPVEHDSITQQDPFYHVPEIISDEDQAGYENAWLDAFSVDMNDNMETTPHLWDIVKEKLIQTKEVLVDDVYEMIANVDGDDDDTPPENPVPPVPPSPPTPPTPPTPPKEPTRPPHHKPPHHKPKDPHHGPHHGHHTHNLTDSTIYQNIGKSNYTKKAFEYINKDEDLVKLLNSTSANITFFVPLDSAFKHGPDHHKDAMEQELKRILYYHVIASVYPAGKVLVSHTIPSMLKEKDLGSSDEVQRIRVGLGFGGLKLNFYSKIVVANIFSSNGVIHGIDHVLIPPPPAKKVIELLPSTFSTFESALYKTGVIKNITNSTDGLTLFIPTNRAFERLGARALAFLFSSYGRKYLKALIEYHIVSGQVLYSDAYINGKDDSLESMDFPRGRFHADLETLNGKSLSVDIARYGRIIRFKVNAFTSIVVQDGIVKDGVIQIPGSVLLPPKSSPPSEAGEAYEDERSCHITVEELKERLQPLL